MMKKFTSDNQKIGEIGENIACKFLMKQGFVIKEKNYTKRYGEIDIISEKKNVLHFIEVKSVSKDLNNKAEKETFNNYQPEDNLHSWKLKRLSRVIQSYLLRINVSDNQEWQFDVIIVFLDTAKKLARVKFIENIIL